MQLRDKLFGFRNMDGSAVPGNVAELFRVRLGGSEQWVSARGLDLSKPVILFLHGGPGSSEMPLIRKYLSPLERDFIVIAWDQRGAGKSYGAGKDRSAMRVSRFVEDARELCEYLKGRFRKDKVFVVGHSWGSLLGVLLVRKYPELFYAYAGIGQCVDMPANEVLSYDFTLGEALRKGNEKAISQLRKIGRPPYPFDSEGRWFHSLCTERKWLGYFGGALFGKRGYKAYFGDYLRSAEYSLADCVNWIRGNVDSIRALWGEVMAHNLKEEALDFSVPVYLFEGRHDYNTPFELVREYYDLIRAPAKGLYWFEDSAHCPCFEEPELFMKRLREAFLGGGLPR
jgi:pimeloyl-ACP methyl ester carboxylesterase